MAMTDLLDRGLIVPVVQDGPPVNVITAHDDRDLIAGTPHHKSVAVRLPLCERWRRN
jgi:hypothetical protein